MIWSSVEKVSEAIKLSRLSRCLMFIVLSSVNASLLLFLRVVHNTKLSLENLPIVSGFRYSSFHISNVFLIEQSKY